MSRYLLGLVGFEPSLPLTANQSLTTGPVKHFSASTYSATTNIVGSYRIWTCDNFYQRKAWRCSPNWANDPCCVKTSWVVNLFSAFGEIIFVRSLPACSQSKEGGLDCDGWDRWVRTTECAGQGRMRSPLRHIPSTFCTLAALFAKFFTHSLSLIWRTILFDIFY